VAEFILKRGGYVYICGDGSGMAKDVTKVLVEVLSEHGGLPVREAEAVLADMKTRRRFVLDIWS
jgi:sulfite reductase alpha subunit-like flavoprotein